MIISLRRPEEKLDKNIDIEMTNFQVREIVVDRTRDKVILLLKYSVQDQTLRQKSYEEYRQELHHCTMLQIEYEA